MATIDEIEQILSRLDNSLGATNEAIRNFRDVLSNTSNGVGNLDDNFDFLNDSVRNNTRSVKDSTSKLEKFKTGLKEAKSNITSGFQSVSEGSESGAKALKGFVDGLGGAISSVASSLPGILGNVLGGLATAITGAISAAMGFVSQLSETNKAVAEAGLLFADTGAGAGIDELNKLAIEAGVPMSTLAETVKSSNDSLRLLAGGPTTGLKAVVKGFNELRTTNERQLDGLYKLGYTTEEIMSGMADFGAAAKMAGKDLNTKELAEGTEKYLKIQRELTKLTGVEAKDAKAKAEALKADIAYRRMIQEVGSTNATTLEKVLSQVNESYQPLVKTLLTGGQVTDQNMALLTQALGEEFVTKVRSIGDQMRSGIQLEPDFVVGEFKNALVKATDSMNNYLSQYSAATLQTIINKGGPFAGFLETLGPIYKDITASKEAAGNMKDTAQAVADGTGQIANTLPEIEKAALQLRAIMYTIGASLVSILAPAITGLAKFTDEKGGAFQQSLGSFTNTINEVQNVLAQPIDPEGNAGFRSETARMKKINELLGDTVAPFLKGDGTGGMFERLFTTLGNTIKDSIVSGLDKGFDLVLNKLNPFGEVTAEEAKTQVTDTNAINKLKDALEGKGAKISSQGQIFLMDEKARNALESYVNAAGTEAISEIRKLGVEVKDVLGRPTFFQQGKSNLPNFKGKEISPANSETEKPKANAFGNIFPYKQGGEIITVAEAGPEVVLPASRGPDGKIGVEVSGAMLDNSRLLQNLVRVNESQATLIAGLNEKMGNMSNFMEKLVQEQRQANRLAV